MSAGAPSSSPHPLSSLVVVPSDPVAMPASPPPPAPPVAAEDEEQQWPTFKMKLFPYAMHCVYGGMGRTGDNLSVAVLVIHYLYAIVTLLSFYTEGEQARFWRIVSSILRFLGCASTTFVACVFIRYYMRVDGEYHVTYYPPQKHLAPAAAEQLPPPPPQMDMC